MTNIEALIFDCDGTLTDSMPVHFVAWQLALGKHGIEFDEERFYLLAGSPSDKIIAMLAEEQGVRVDLAQVAQEKMDGFLQSIHLIEPIPAVIDVVRQHHGRLKMAVASGGRRQVVMSQLNQIGLENHFEVIVTAEDTERHKPHPDVFLEAARQLGVAAEACRVYEDADQGVEAARRAGMEWVDIRQFHTPRRLTDEGA